MSRFARSIAERVFRNRSFKRQLPPEFAGSRLWVTPDSQLKYLKPGAEGFDAELLGAVSELVRPQMSVWDVGANVGVSAFAAAFKIGPQGSVFAIEADPFLADLLRRSASLPEYGDRKIDVLCAAASEMAGVAALLVAKRGRASNALEIAGGRSEMGGARAKISVPTLPLDTFLQFQSHPDLIKIDVEGAEALVLRGAANILSVVRPTFLI